MGIILFISGQEIFVVMVVILLLFGADKLPEFAKTIGKGMRDFRKASDEIRREIESSTRDIRNEMNDIGESLTHDAEEIRGNIQKNVDYMGNAVNKDLQEAADGFQKHIDDINQTVESVSDDYNYSTNDYLDKPDTDSQQTDPLPGGENSFSSDKSESNPENNGGNHS